jgi:heme-degrading monooxygenase HmoA
VFSVIFEVHPRSDRFDDYLGLAKQLRPTLESMDGFIENERFKSTSRTGWVLSHSAWRDEKSLIRWRTLGEHHEVQQQGRDEILGDYRLRVGDVTADSDGEIHEQRFDTTETGPGIVASLTEIMSPSEHEPEEGGVALVGVSPRTPAIVDHDAFTSIYTPGKIAILIAWNDAETSRSWTPTVLEPYTLVRHRVIRIVRDYTMRDRREAPQYYPAPASRPPVSG